MEYAKLVKDSGVCKKCRKKSLNKENYKSKKGDYVCAKCNQKFENKLKKKNLNECKECPTKCKVCEKLILKTSDLSNRRGVCKTCANERRRQLRKQKKESLLNQKYAYSIQDNNFKLRDNSINGLIREYTTSNEKTLDEISNYNDFTKIKDFLKKITEIHHSKVNFGIRVELGNLSDKSTVFNTTQITSDPINVFFKETNFDIVFEPIAKMLSDLLNTSVHSNLRVLRVISFSIFLGT